MRCIADANVLLPVLVEGHAHQAPAATWWDGCNDGDVGLSFPVRMALLRLLSSSRVMGASVLRPAQAWGAVQSLIDDPRIEVLDQLPAAHGKLWYDNVVRRAQAELREALLDPAEVNEVSEYLRGMGVG